MGVRVLIVDDEPEIVEYLSLFLEKHQITTVGVFTPEEGIAASENEKFDAIITDFRMPKMTGLEMVSRIKGGILNRRTPVIVLSGNLTEEVLERLEKLGIINVMSKPPELDILLRIIEKAGRLGATTKGATYDSRITQAFHEAFCHVMNNHLGSKIKIHSPVEPESAPTDVEFSGHVTLFGRRVSGMITVSYQSGFTEEFAKTLLGRSPSAPELEVFETTTGDLAGQVAACVMPKLAKEVGIHVTATSPLIVQGRRAGIPMAVSQPRVMSSLTLNGKHCFMKFALVDLAESFQGMEDAFNGPLVIQNAP